MKSLATRLSSLRRVVASVLLLAAMKQGAMAQTPGQRQTYDTYRMVKTRNIFDPDRRPLTPATQASAPLSKGPARVDYVSLVGIMATDARLSAFFSGSRPEYDKVLLPGAKIADISIVSVKRDSIEIERAGKRFTLNVGQELPLDGSGPRNMTIAQDDPAAANSTSAITSSAPGNTGNTNSAVPSGAAISGREDVIRRMMEKRQQELK